MEQDGTDARVFRPLRLREGSQLDLAHPDAVSSQRTSDVSSAWEDHTFFLRNTTQKSHMHTLLTPPSPPICLSSHHCQVWEAKPRELILISQLIFARVGRASPRWCRLFAGSSGEGKLGGAATWRPLALQTRRSLDQQRTHPSRHASRNRCLPDQSAIGTGWGRTGHGSMGEVGPKPSKQSSHLIPCRWRREKTRAQCGRRRREVPRVSRSSVAVSHWKQVSS